MANWRDLFKPWILERGPGTEPSQWQDHLEQIILDHSDYRGRLDYDRAYHCMMDIVEYLEESLIPLLIEGKLLDAAKLVMTVYDSAGSTGISSDT